MIRIIFVLAVSIIGHVALFHSAEKIAYALAPEYTPISHDELREVFPSYYTAEGTLKNFGHDPTNELRNAKIRNIIAIASYHHQRVFEVAHVDNNREFVENAAHFGFSAVYLFVVFYFLKRLYGCRHAVFAFFGIIFSTWGGGKVASRVNMNLSVREFERLKQLHDNGLISDETFENKKSVIRSKINANLS